MPAVNGQLHPATWKWAILAKPVLAINTATYWHALRQSGIDDKVPGFGPLLAVH